MIRAVIRTVVALCVIAGGAAADPIALPDTKVVLDLPTGWTRVPTTAIVAGYHDAGGRVLAVTRAKVPNPDAWRAKTRDGYAAQIERGAAAAGRVVRRKVGEVNGVPVLDLELARGGATLVLRVLMFRTYVLALAIEVPRGGALGDTRAIAGRFAPPPP